MEGEKILIVEADSKVIQLATLKLSNAGYWVSTATDGETALEKAKNTPPDLLIISHNLPDKSGIELCFDLINFPQLKNVPVIMMVDTETSINEAILKEYKLRIDDTIIKPFTPKNLLTKVDAVVFKNKLIKHVNPITLLPGKVHVKEEVELRIQNARLFELIFCDLKGLAIFNKVYGYEKGNEVIKLVTDILEDEMNKKHEAEAILYQIEGGCFCVLLNIGYANDICDNIINKFSKEIKEFYDKEDQQRGGVVLKNRRGIVEQKPIMTIGLGIISNETRNITGWLEAEEIGYELLEYAKTMHGSRFVRDRRQS